MKDSFFQWLDRKYNKIYAVVTKVAYISITKKRSKGAPQLSKTEKSNIRKYWKEHYGKRVPLWEYKWYKKVGLKADPELIPDVIWHSKVEPFFNNLQLEKGFQDKNYFELIVGEKNSPQSIIHCINGQYLDHSYNPINEYDLATLFKKEKEYICKPSIDSGGGRGIQFIKGIELDKDKFKTFEKQYNLNYLIQSIIQQSSFMASFNESSINSIRIVSFLHNGVVRILSSFLRIGNSGSKLDNVSGGGLFIQVNNDGSFGSMPYKEELTTHDLVQAKVDNDIERMFKQAIPNWNTILQVVKQTHYKLAHFGIINWDIALDYQDTPIVIEYNIIDASTYFHQLNVGPIFGDLTTEVIEEIRNEH